MKQFTELEKLQYELSTIQDNHYDDMTLSLERIRMLKAVIDDIAHALEQIERYTHKELIEPINTRLGIGQLLAMDFIQQLSDEVKRMEDKA